MIIVRKPESIYQSHGRIEKGTFDGRWHFSFDQYYDPENSHFGTLRVFNDDTLSPGAVWLLHPHREIEVVTYCADGEFRHADENGKGGVLQKGWVQHTTVGKGMFHSEINNRPDVPMRFIQVWFTPSARGLKPSVEQKEVKKAERENRLLPLVSDMHPGALPIFSNVRVYSCFLEGSGTVNHTLETHRGVYLYVLEGGPIRLNGHRIVHLGPVRVIEEPGVNIQAEWDTELLLVDVPLI